MTVEVVTWVFKHSEATLGARLVLLALANYAHDDGTNSYPSVETLTEHTRMTRRAVQSALRKLEAEGHIEAVGSTKYGTTVYTVRGVVATPPDSMGGVDHAGDTSSTTPEPLKGKTKDIHDDVCVVGGSRGGISTLRKADLTVPAPSTPKALIERIAPVLEVLRRVHSERGGVEPSVRGASLALNAYPDRDHLSVASELEHWMLAGNGQSQPCKDVTRRYRTFLAHSPAGTAARPSRNGRPRNRTMREREALMDLA